MHAAHVIRSHLRSLEVIRGHQRSLEAIRSTYMHDAHVKSDLCLTRRQRSRRSQPVQCLPQPSSLAQHERCAPASLVTQRRKVRGRMVGLKGAVRVPECLPRCAQILV